MKRRIQQNSNRDPADWVGPNGDDDYMDEFDVEEEVHPQVVLI